MTLAGRRALVTGGKRRIGRGIATALAAAGCDVAINDLERDDDAEETLRRIEAHGRRAVFHGADISDADAVGAMVDAVVDDFGGLDILVNNPYWCDHQPIPCYEPGTPIEEVFPDQPDKWVQLRGFFEPGAYKSGTRGYSFAKFGHDASTLSNKLLQEYLGDAVTLEEASVELQALLEEEADKAIREHPEWDTSDW